MRIWVSRLLIMSVVAMVAACGGGGGSDGSGNSSGGGGGAYDPAPGNVAKLAFVDANNQPLANAEIKLVSEAEAKKAKMAKSAGSAGLTFPSASTFPDFSAVAGLFLDEKGELDISEIVPGIYFVQLTHNSVQVYHIVQIAAGNAVVLFSITMPISCDLSSCTEVDSIVGSLSGMVYDDKGPIEGAQVSLGAGAATNGAYAVTTTNAEGEYSLSFNVSKDLAETLATSTLRAVAPGYQTSSQAIEVNSGSLAGVNIKLEKAEQDQGSVLWRETFEADSATRDLWQKEGGLAETRWQYLNAGHGISNNLVGSYVKLAPGDLSAGALPQALQGQVSYWYGDVTQGNFIGERDQDGSVNDDGGLSVSEHQGGLVSPSIDLSEESVPLALSFRAWWEIESVNPNENGFDLMMVQVSTDGGSSFENLARLNPLADPESSLERDAIPYSNAGFNAPPVNAQQEPISLDAYAGESDVVLRFVFSTEDELYNGFRGWVLDDVVISRTEGSFPLYEGDGEDEVGGMEPMAKSGLAGTGKRVSR